MLPLDHDAEDGSDRRHLTGALIEDLGNPQQRTPSSADVDDFIHELRAQMRRDKGELFDRFVIKSDEAIAESTLGADTETDDAAPIPAVRAGRTSRYTILKGIAAGGMGIIYRAHDRLLDREVALKVLATGRDESILLQRFVTESRVLAQLQHPGIPPVYEEGWLPDGRAFIAMKLVEGHTLGQLLDARPAPESDIVKFLSIFHQICEAVAFAHANGVLHRDLKPENVMVGEFGEVQLIDWGLARCRATAEVNQNSRKSWRKSDETPPGSDYESPTLTLAGGAIGTPAYMPPEQANGDHEDVGPTSDVFSLGGILATILTGEPPFLGQDVHEIVGAARAAAVEDVHQRLHACHADQTLKDLAICCLQARPEDRPPSVSQIVDVLDRHQSSIQDRLWEMELAHTKQVEQRRRRRLATALIVSASLFVTILSGGWAMVVRQESARQRGAVELVSGSLSEAELLRETALANPLRDEQEWFMAAEAVRRAQEVSPQTKDAALIARVSTLATHVHQEADAARRDRELVTQLKIATRPVSIVDVRERHPEIQRPHLDAGRRAQHGGPPGFHHRGPSPGTHGPRMGGDGRGPGGHHSPGFAVAHEQIIQEIYITGFSSYELDPTTVGVQAAVRHLLSRPDEVRHQVVDGMHRWLGVLTRVTTDCDPCLGWVLAVLEGIDPDPQRNEIRRWVSDGDQQSLNAVVRNRSVLDHPPSFIWFVAQHLDDPDDSQDLIQMGRNRYPVNLLLNQTYAEQLERSGEIERAVDVFWTVLAIHEDAQTCVRLGLMLMRLDRIDEAEMLLRTAIRIDGRNSDAYPVLTRMLLSQERFEEAIDLSQKGLVEISEDSHLHSRIRMSLGAAYAKLGRDDEALRTYCELLATDDLVPHMEEQAHYHIRKLNERSTAAD